MKAEIMVAQEAPPTEQNSENILDLQFNICAGKSGA